MLGTDRCLIGGFRALLLSTGLGAGLRFRMNPWEFVILVVAFLFDTNPRLSVSDMKY